MQAHSREFSQYMHVCGVGRYGRLAVVLACLAIVGGVLSACAGAPTLDRLPQTAIQDKLDETDLSARGPQQVKHRSHVPPGDSGAARAARLYPGNDQVSAKQPTERNFAGIRSAGDGYELNFENANLSDTVKVILGETLRKPYVFDPRLQGQVTLSTGRPVSESELLSILEIVLQINNATLVLSEGKYRIVPSSAATNATKRLVSLSAPGASDRPGYGVSVLPLRHISAGQMLKLIDGFVTKAGSIRADVSRNLLLLRGSGPERRTLLDVATSFDLDWLKGRAAGIFPLSFATAEEIIPELNKILESGKGGRGHGTVKFEAIKRLNAVLVLAQRNKTLRAVATWIKRLDKTNNNGVNVYVYNVEHAKAGALAKILNATFAKGSDGANTASDVSPEKEAAASLNDNSDGFNKNQSTNGAQTNPDAGTQSGTQTAASETTNDKAAKADSASLQPASGGEGDVRIVPDTENNTLLIRGRPRDYRRVLATLRGLDRPPLQIMINATIAEVTLNDNLRYGVQFFLRGKKWGGVNVADSTGLPLAQAFPGLNFVLGTLANPRVVLDALSNVTKVQVVSSPSLVVLDNQAAKLKVGSEVPVITQQSTSLDAGDARVVNAVQFRDTGVILKVIPRVSTSGLVTMEVQQEISSVAPSSEPGSLTPTINQRRINSTIAVYSGQTVLLGGLISEEDSREKDRVPIVKQIPILGELIGQTNNGRSRTELIVFIRPQVIRDGHDASLAAQELANRLRLVQPAAPSRWHK